MFQWAFDRSVKTTQVGFSWTIVAIIILMDGGRIRPCSVVHDQLGLALNRVYAQRNQTEIKRRGPGAGFYGDNGGGRKVFARRLQRPKCRPLLLSEGGYARMHQRSLCL